VRTAGALAAVGTFAILLSPALSPLNSAGAMPVLADEQRVRSSSAPTPSRTDASARTDASTSAHTGWDGVSRGRLDGRVFSLALAAADCAVRAGAVARPSTLTVIDYSLPSTLPRLWVFDLRSRRLLYEELVAHGVASGENFATSFSNDLNSRQTSLGLFVTEGTYVGSNGYSLRLQGLDRGFNDRARERAIVMHGAPYVDAALARAQGRLGRSWGCPALREGIAREVIDRVKGGSLVFAYYPHPEWLDSSEYLGSCAAAN
jgi:hypothetical protein